MKKINRIVALGALAASIALPAYAQIVSSSGSNVVTNAARYNTYSVAFAPITTAASLTDLIVLTGSATKTIYLRELECSGSATAAGAATLALVKRSTADTAGTQVTPSASLGGQTVPLDSSAAAATATVKGYTANPTTGTLVGLIRSAQVNLSPPATGNGAALLHWQFALDNQQSPTLRGVAQQIAVNGLGASFPAGSAVGCSLTWIEQ